MNLTTAILADALAFTRTLEQSSWKTSDAVAWFEIGRGSVYEQLPETLVGLTDADIRGALLPLDTAAARR